MLIFGLLLALSKAVEYTNHKLIKLNLPNEQKPWFERILAQLETVNLWEDLEDETPEVC